MIDALRSLQLKSPRVLDLGAHVGEFANLARGLWSGCHLSCVEASDDCLPFLKPIADDLKHALLWNEPDQTRPFWRRKIDAHGGSSGNSCFRENTGFFDDREVACGNVWLEWLRTTTIDALFADAPAFDLVKLDLQGAELNAIRGGKRTLSRATVILCEQQLLEYNEGAPYAHEVDEEIRFLQRRLDKNDEPVPDFRLAWESDHEIVGRFQVDRLYVKIGSDLDLRMRMEEREKRAIRIQEEAA